MSQRKEQEQVYGVNVFNIRRGDVERHVSFNKWKMANMTFVSQVEVVR